MKLPQVTKHGLCHYSHLAGHLAYLMLVFIESHGLYGIAAGVLAVILLITELADR